IFVALTIAGGTGLLFYAAAALVMPTEGSDESLATQALREHRDRPWLVIGIGLLALGGIFVLSGPHVFWGAGGGIWALALVAGALALDDVSLRGGIGDRAERPLSVRDLQKEYRLGIGELDVDLRKLELPPGETTISARVGIGDLVIEVPEDVAVAVTGKVHGGDLEILGRDESGWHVHQRVVGRQFEAAERRLVVDATVGLGDLEVRH